MCLVPSNLISAVCWSFFLIGLGHAAVMTFGVLWLSIPFVGYLLADVVGSVAVPAGGTRPGLLLVSTPAKDEQQAFALAFFLINPFFILSGLGFRSPRCPSLTVLLCW